MDSWDVARLEVALGMHTLRPIDPAALRKKVRRVTRHKGFDSRTLVSTSSIHLPKRYLGEKPSSDGNALTGRLYSTVQWHCSADAGLTDSILIDHVSRVSAQQRHQRQVR